MNQIYVCSNTLQHKSIFFGSSRQEVFFIPRLMVMRKTSQPPADSILERRLVSLVRNKSSKCIDLRYGINIWPKLSIFILLLIWYHMEKWNLISYFKNPLISAKINNFDYWSNEEKCFSVYTVMWHEKVMNLVQRKKYCLATRI